MRGFDMVSNWATPETVHSSGVQVSKREQSFRTSSSPYRCGKTWDGRQERTSYPGSKDKPCEGNQPSAARVGLLAGRVAT